ncbi:unnamed protein product [Candida verbasci]|uniref:Ribosomal protein L19 n=1 Tax=Candida verbasci TaxID=1227364 RepID=A0A9W4U1L2_9ASCO|nr:unnamed protein product [Candida verbasci]
MLKSSSPIIKSSIIQSIRGFRYLKKELPTVYEGLQPKRNGKPVMEYIHQQMLAQHDPLGTRTKLINRETGLRSGDIIKVTYNDRTEVIGSVLAIKRGNLNLGHNILIRTKLNKVGSEIRIPLFNPNIRNIEILHKPEKYLPRHKLYYIRGTNKDVGDVETFVKKLEAKKHDKK